MQPPHHNTADQPRQRANGAPRRDRHRHELHVVLSVGVSRTRPDDVIDLWCRVPELAPNVEISIWIVGTGNPMPTVLHDERARFLGTVICPNKLVWHVFVGPNR